MGLIEEINEWDSNLERPFYSYNFNSIYEILDYKEKKFFKHYSPTAGSAHSGFWDRLESWLENVHVEKEKKALFEFTLNIHFVTREDFTQLFLSAYSGPIKRWIIDLHDIALDQQLDTNQNTQLLERTWYGSVTDMNLGEFYRVNRISGTDVRTDFNTIVKLGDPAKIQAYINGNNITQMVSIEDFIGSGDQFMKILNIMPSCLKRLPVLIVPLIICSDGLNNIKSHLMTHSFTNWHIEPVVIIDFDDCLTSKTELTNKPLEKNILEIAKYFSTQIIGGVSDEWVYGSAKTGSLVVLYSNTPDNTMPFIWWTEDWNALFPRSSRI